MKKRRVAVNDLMQSGYIYYCVEPVGKNFHPDFRPELSPKETLELGVFGGKYMTDCKPEFPASWFKKAKLSPEGRNAKLNYFQVNASVPLRVWRKKGWIYHEDPRGWFQWYCRYYMGRRCVDDERQIKRWRAIRRHIAQIKNNCPKRELECRPKQRQSFVTRYAALMRNGFDAPPDVLLKKFLNLDLNDPRTTANALALIEAKIRLLEQSYGL